MPACSMRPARSVPVQDLGREAAFSEEQRAWYAQLSAKERRSLLRVERAALFARIRQLSCGRCHGLFALRRAQPCTAGPRARGGRGSELWRARGSQARAIMFVKIC